jgi:hypothetical protein
MSKPAAARARLPVRLRRVCCAGATAGAGYFLRHLYALAAQHHPSLRSEAAMDLWFLGLMLLLSLLTWGGVVLCARLLQRP